MALGPRSMTGFGRARLRSKGLEVEVEIRSVNHRYLQIRQRLPEEFSPFEPAVEEQLRKRLRRGAVTLTATVVRSRSERPVRVRADLAKRYLEDLRRLKKGLRLEGEPTLDRIVTLPGVLEPAEENGRRAEKEFAHLQRAVGQALSALEACRAREGRVLERDLRGRLSSLSRLCERVASRSPSLVEEYRGRLRRRVEELLSGAGVVLKPEDLAREVALFAARSDIAEELARLRSHIAEFGRTLQKGAEAGRQLDFLLQEMNRETNTLGAKSGDAAIAHAVVEMKGEIERIREQVQNLE